MLSNAYVLAKFCFDTAENEPAKNWQKFCKNFAKFANFANPDLGRAPAAPDAGGRLLALPRGPGRRAGARLRERRRVVAKFWQNFARFRLYRQRYLQVSTCLSAFFLYLQDYLLLSS